MSVKGIHWAQEMRGVCPYRKALLFALGERHHKDQNIVIADQVMLADDAGMTDRTVRKYLRLLEQDGLVFPRVVGVPGGGRISHYMLAFDRKRPLNPVADRKDVPDRKPENCSASKRKEIPDQKPDQTGTSLPDRSGTCVPLPKDTIEHEEKKTPAIDLKPAFEALWAVWPTKGRERSKAKAKVFDQFKLAAAVPGGDAIVASAKAWLRGKDPAFTPALDRWLRDGKYEHHLPAATAQDPAAAALTREQKLYALETFGRWDPDWGPRPAPTGALL